MKKIIIYTLCIVVSLSSLQVFVCATGTTQTNNEVQIKSRGKGEFEIISGQEYFHFRKDYFDFHDEWGDITDELNIDEKTAVRISNSIFQKLYGKEFIKDKACFLKDDKGKNAFTVSRRYKEQGLKGSWWSISIDKNHGTILKIWSYDDANLTGNINIDARTALDIGDYIFEQFYGKEFYEKNNYFVVKEIKNTDIIVVARMNDDINVDGDGVSLAINRKTNKILKIWGGE